MSQRFTKTVKTETEVVQPHDTPDVLAYRVGQLEKTTAAGLKEVKDELVNLKTHFVTHQELESVKTQTNLELKEIRKDVTELQGWNKWGVRIVLATVILAVLGGAFASTKL